MSWRPTKLSAITELITKGTTPTTLGHEFADEGIPFLRVQNISEGGVNYERDTLFVNSETHLALKRSQIQPGDVLVSIAGSIGRAGVVPDDAPQMNCNQAVAILRPTKAVHKLFLRLWIEGADAQRQIRSSTVTGTISNLSLSQLGNLEIPLPALAEQRRIAEVLDRAEALRAKRRAALAQLDSLTQSLFLDLFGDPYRNPKDWPQARLDAVCSLVNGRAFKPEEWETEGLPIIRIQNLNDPSKPFNYTRQNLPEKVRVRKGDILFSWSGTPGTSFGCFRWSGPEGWLNQHIFNVRLNGELDGEFFICQLNLKLGELIGKAHGGVGLQHVTKGMVDETILLVPPIPLQREFARRVTAVETLKTLHRAALAELDALFASLQHRAFSGQL